MFHYTNQQIANFKKFKQVQHADCINMAVGSEGLEATGLTKADYTFVLINYEELEKQAELQDSLNPEPS
jgi:hypothetical protein